MMAAWVVGSQAVQPEENVMDRKFVGWKTLAVWGVVVAAGLTVLWSAGGCQRSSAKSVKAIGSTSILPFAELLAQQFNQAHADLRVEVQGGGSTAGIQALQNGIADIGMCSRALKDDEAKTLTPVMIARDGLAIVVNNANPVSGMTKEQIRKIFSGEIKDWKEMEGGKEGTIRVIVREEGSGTREAFMTLVMGKTELAKGAMAQESTGAVKELVKSDAGAIGFMSLGQVGQEVKALSVDGATASADGVKDGKYPLWRPFLFVLKGQASPDSQRFIDFVLSEDGQKAMEKEGLVRVK
jgi:phosphate transport system substrate-binding protein